MVNSIKGAGNIVNQMKIGQQKQTKNAKILASGKKVNTAADDAAVLAISQKIMQSINTANAKSSNYSSQIYSNRIADGALSNVSDTLNDMSVNAIRSMNGLMSDSDREVLSANSEALKGTIDHIKGSAVYNENKVLENFDLDFDVNDLDSINAASDAVSKKRSALGAEENGLSHAVAANDIEAENLTAAYSRSVDADMAKAVTDYKNQQLINQTQNAFLAKQLHDTSNITKILQ